MVVCFGGVCCWSVYRLGREFMGSLHSGAWGFHEREGAGNVWSETMIDSQLMAMKHHVLKMLFASNVKDEESGEERVRVVMTPQCR